MQKIYFLFFLLVAAISSKSQWTNDISTNTIAAQTRADIMHTANTADGRTWIAFYGTTNNKGNEYVMRVQLINAAGERMFGDSGILISDKTVYYQTPDFNVCVDKNNNLIVTYNVGPRNNYECYVQKVSVTGQFLWGNEGIDLGMGKLVCPLVLSTNEVIVAWENDKRKISYQKISADGNLLWAAPKILNGKTVYLSTPQLVLAGNDMFYLVYQDHYIITEFNTHLFIQKFNSNGSVVWQDPIQISTQVTNGNNCDVFAEKDTVYTGYYASTSEASFYGYAYVQKINPDGSLPFGNDGAAFAPAMQNQSGRFIQAINIAKNSLSNFVWAVCTVAVTKTQTSSGVYVQKFNAVTGENYFGNNAKQVVPVSNQLNRLASSQISFCNENPVFIVANNYNALAAVKLRQDGSFAWKNKLAFLSKGNPFYGSKGSYFGFSNFYNGQAVAVWQQDNNNLFIYKPYVQNLRCDGSTGPDVSNVENSALSSNIIILKSVYPNPVQDNLTVVINTTITARATILITDVKGNIKLQFQQQLQIGNNKIKLNVALLKTGNYFIKVASEKGECSAMFSK